MKTNCEESATCYVKNNKLNAIDSEVNYTSIVCGKKRVVKNILNDTKYASVTSWKSKALDNKGKSGGLSGGCDKSDVPNISKATTASDNKKIEDTAPILPPRRGNGDNAFKHLKLHHSQCQTDFTNGNLKLFQILVLGCVITGVINLIIWVPGLLVNYEDQKLSKKCLNTGKGNCFLSSYCR